MSFLKHLQLAQANILFSCKFHHRRLCFRSYAVARGVGTASWKFNTSIFKSMTDSRLGDFHICAVLYSTHTRLGSLHRVLRAEPHDARVLIKLQMPKYSISSVDKASSSRRYSSLLYILPPPPSFMLLVGRTCSWS